MVLEVFSDSMVLSHSADAPTAEKGPLVMTLNHPLRFSQGFSNIYMHIVEGKPQLKLSLLRFKNYFNK